MDKVDRIASHVSDAIGKTIHESLPMLQEKFEASGQEVAAGVGRALTQLCCGAVAGIALGANANDTQLADLTSELINRISPILVEYGSAAREKAGV